MKQILQNLGNGDTMMVEVPAPGPSSGKVLIETTRTLVSLGTEKMLIDFGKGSLLEKARSQPDKVKQVLQKVRTDGLMATVDAVRSKLDQPIPLGYCHVGRVAAAPGMRHEAGGMRHEEGFEAHEAGGMRHEQGFAASLSPHAASLMPPASSLSPHAASLMPHASPSAASRFAPGDRVVSNGYHAEVVSVPENLCARIPDGVSDEAAAFTVVGAIGLQGIRLLNPTLGERVVVMGLGLIGLLTVQMLRASGCRVLGVDLDPAKCALAGLFGVEVCDLSKGQDAVAAAAEFSDGKGVDGVIITASAKTDQIVHDAATMCRKRGRIVLVGVVGLKLQRDDFYKKELSFQVSCSYGPGRYDPLYEGKGYDYPEAYVRWTEQRNFEAVLQLMADGKLVTGPLVSHRFPFEKALDAYAVVGSGKALGIVLEYGEPTGGSGPKFARAIQLAASPVTAKDQPGVSFIGAGNFTARNLLPAVQKAGGARLRWVISRGGTSAGEVGRKFGFAHAGSDVGEVWRDEATDLAFITTPHSSHGRLVAEALEAGKHVFVEKPLALTHAELDRIEALLGEARGARLMVGFNRRFSPHTVQIKRWLEACPGAKSIVITVNAGEIPADHWTQYPDIGGGRILGEACHFIDLARHLAGSAIEEVKTVVLGGQAGALGDSVVISLAFADGSIASVQYLATGHKGFPKERVEVFAGGKVMACENFRVTRGWGVKGGCKTRSQDKGHAACVAAFLETVRTGGAAPIPPEELLEVSRATLAAALRH
jgi:predicted dehydrogenase/threonine dehydrogenase-like Zn-dependent dehydrogenase